ncbi:MAG: HDOD domain-containing protein [bacterium]|nr:HDOD domain-containing protein [bacterium]
MPDEKNYTNEILVTRQPIFDSKKEVFAYELFFKGDFSANVKERCKADGDTALRAVDGFLINGLRILSGGKKVFINFNHEMMVTEIPSMFPKSLLGIAIPTQPDTKMSRAVKKLKEQGYLLLLNELALDKKNKKILAMVDIIGRDFRGMDIRQQRELFDQNAPLVKFLAKSVETASDYKAADSQGYEYFQGDFFSKGDLVPMRNIPSYKINFLRILKEINKPDVQFEEIEKILKQDVSITYKLLRFVNSPNFGLKGTVQSIRHALNLLGEMEVRKWLSLIILSGTGTNKPQELIKSTVVRAKFCESLAVKLRQKKELSNYFLMGMFSMVDAFLDRPLPEVLSELPLDDKVKGALLGDSRNKLRQVLDAVLDYERGDWRNFSISAKKLKLAENDVARCYLESVEWAQ